MGRHVGSRDRAQLGALDESEVEVLGRLVAEYPMPVPPARLFHLTTGEWASEGSAATAVSRLRLRLGDSAIATVVRRRPDDVGGYVATHDTFAVLGIPFPDGSEESTAADMPLTETLSALLGEAGDR